MVTTHLQANIILHRMSLAPDRECPTTIQPSGMSGCKSTTKTVWKLKLGTEQYRVLLVLVRSFESYCDSVT